MKLFPSLQAKLKLEQQQRPRNFQKNKRSTPKQTGMSSPIRVVTEGNQKLH